jgi:hypothetical protein
LLTAANCKANRPIAAAGAGNGENTKTGAVQYRHGLQLLALYNYEKSVLNGYVEVFMGIAKINNLQNEFALKLKQVTGSR